MGESNTCGRTFGEVYSYGIVEQSGSEEPLLLPDRPFLARQSWQRGCVSECLSAWAHAVHDPHMTCDIHMTYIHIIPHPYHSTRVMSCAEDVAGFHGPGLSREAILQVVKPEADRFMQTLDHSSPPIGLQNPFRWGLYQSRVYIKDHQGGVKKG